MSLPASDGYPDNLIGWAPFESPFYRGGIRKGDFPSPGRAGLRAGVLGMDAGLGCRPTLAEAHAAKSKARRVREARRETASVITPPMGISQSLASIFKKSRMNRNPNEKRKQ